MHIQHLKYALRSLSSCKQIYTAIQIKGVFVELGFGLLELSKPAEGQEVGADLTKVLVAWI